MDSPGQALPNGRTNVLTSSERTHERAADGRTASRRPCTAGGARAPPGTTC
jgi:hypothetical protein